MKKDVRFKWKDTCTNTRQSSPITINCQSFGQCHVVDWLVTHHQYGPLARGCHDHYPCSQCSGKHCVWLGWVGICRPMQDLQLAESRGHFLTGCRSASGALPEIFGQLSNKRQYLPVGPVDVSFRVASSTKWCFHGQPTRLALVLPVGLLLEPFGHPGWCLGGVLTSGAIWIKVRRNSGCDRQTIGHTCDRTYSHPYTVYEHPAQTNCC